MRIAVGGIYHESNTFFSQPMTVEKFAEQALHCGESMLSYWRGTASEMGGFIEAAGRFGFELVPTIMAWGWPLGALSSEAFETLTGELLTRINAAGRLDGILLSLHGAMVSEGYPDADGEILRRVRNAIGPAVPIVLTLDYHANLTEEMVRWPDAIVGYDTYPHVDQAERGFEAADIMRRVLKNGLRPTIALARKPFLPHILSQLTERPPMSDAIDMAHQLEKRPEIISVTVAAGFPYCDVPDAGFGVLVITQGNSGVAREAAEMLAESIWQRRREFALSIPGPEEAVREAIAERQELTVLVDVGDNLRAGTPGDGTVLLHELLK